MFDHKQAQAYELDWGTKWIAGDGYPVIRDALARQRNRELWMRPIYIQEFFESRLDLAEQFFHTLVGKTSLEIGCGPIPGLAVLGTHFKRLYYIDPLINTYNQLLLKTFGDSWDKPNVIACAQPAEFIVPQLHHAVDGTILCHNTLDHTENPFQVLETLAYYSAPGCALMFWSDLWYHFPPDAGHRNVTQNVSEILDRLTPYFDIQRTVPVYPRHNTLHYGCFAIRK